MITQRVDADDPALGATVAKLRALAAHVDELVVLTLVARPVDLPANVRVRGVRREGAATARRSPRRVCSCRSFAAGPSPCSRTCRRSTQCSPRRVTRPLRVPLLLWFTHWRQSPTLRLAERLSTKILSVSEQSFPLPSRKVVATGHGIEVPAERPAPRAHDGTLRIVSLGRTSPAKGLSTVVRGSAAPRRHRGRSRAARAVADGGRADAPARAGSADRRARARRPRSARGPRGAIRHTVGLRTERRARQQHARRGARQGRL